MKGGISSMKKKHAAALLMAASLSAAALSGCGKKPADTETTAQETTVSESASTEAETAADVSLGDILDDIKEAYGESYLPDSEINGQTMKNVVGLSPDLCEEYVGEMPMISTHVETFIGVKAKEGSADDVENAMTAYRDYLLNDAIQYPMNLPTLEASQVVRHDNYVFFVMVGRPDDQALEEGDEAALASAKENNQKAIDIIDGYFR